MLSGALKDNPISLYIFKWHDNKGADWLTFIYDTLLWLELV